MRSIAIRVLLILTLATRALASDGVIEINQAAMLAGNVTPGDAPGSPVKLSVPGSYRLTSDLVLTGIHDAGIQVATDAGVTIDLNGFAIRGPFACAPGNCPAAGVGYGILQAPPGTGEQITIRNGRIVGMSGACILIGARSRVENVELSACGEGIVIGANGMVVGNRIERVRLNGLRLTGTATGVMFERNAFTENGLGGVAGSTASISGTPIATSGNYCADDACRSNLARKRFYLTKTTHLGDTPIGACAPGFHFASLWEIFDVSQLDYDTTLGRTTSDSGSGPPRLPGWVRSGSGFNFQGQVAGWSNCESWTTTTYHGTAVTLPSPWSFANTPESPITPWEPTILLCTIPTPAWCIQD